MTLIELNSFEWKHVFRTALDVCATLPKTGKFQPYYNATSWDHDDLYRVAREQAISSRSAVIQLVRDKEIQGKWPKGQYQTKFWLQARWETVVSRAEFILRQSRYSANFSGATATANTQQALKRLWLDYWDEFLVDYWLAENLGGYTSFETYGTFPEDYAYYSKWLDKLSGGHYIQMKAANG